MSPVNWYRVAAEVLQYAAEKLKDIGEQVTLEQPRALPPALDQLPQIDQLSNLSLRTRNILRKSGVDYTQLRKMTKQELVALGLGQTSISEIEELL